MGQEMKQGMKSNVRRGHKKLLNMKKIFGGKKRFTKQKEKEKNKN